MTAAAIHMLTSRFILSLPNVAMRHPWVTFSCLMRACKLADIHRITN